MEDKILMEFAAWLPESGAKEFAEKSPEECIMRSDELISSSEEGKKMIKALFTKFQNSKNTTGAFNTKVEYLKALRAQKGAKIKEGSLVGPDAIPYSSEWTLIDDTTDSEGNRRQTIQSDLWDRIILTTNTKGDSVYHAKPVVFYDGRQEDPYIYAKSRRHYNPSAWKDLNVLQKLWERYQSPGLKPNNWKEAQSVYGDFFKKATSNKED